MVSGLWEGEGEERTANAINVTRKAKKEGRELMSPVTRCVPTARMKATREIPAAMGWRMRASAADEDERGGRACEGGSGTGQAADDSGGNSGGSARVVGDELEVAVRVKDISGGLRLGEETYYPNLAFVQEFPMQTPQFPMTSRSELTLNDPSQHLQYFPRHVVLDQLTD